MALLIIAAQGFAESNLNKNCCQPLPVGGFKALQERAVYPLYDRELHNSGQVILSFYVDANGNVSDIKVTDSGGKSFDASAVMAVMGTKWTPAKQNGFPVGVTYQLPFEFHAK